MIEFCYCAELKLEGTGGNGLIWYNLSRINKNVYLISYIFIHREQVHQHAVVLNFTHLCLTLNKGDIRTKTFSQQ